MSFALAARRTSADPDSSRRPPSSSQASDHLMRRNSTAGAIALGAGPRAAAIQRACGCLGGPSLEENAMGRAAAQPSLTVSSPGDPSELEAERAADQVMRMTEEGAPHLSAMRDGASLHRACAACSLTARGDLASTVQAGISGGGNALDDATRSFMESRFDRDFSHVRVHTSASAAESARALDAQAYTVGGDIVFAAGKYSPETNSGRRLIAHELAHTVQQGTGSEAGRASGPSLQRWPVSVMMQSSCSGKSKGNCSGSCTHPTSGKPGTCRWSGTITYGCVCYENPTSAAAEAIMAALQAFLIALGIVLAIEVIAAIAACVASGVCEAAAIIGLAGYATGLLIIGFLESQGVTIT